MMRRLEVEQLAALPGWEIISQGLADVAAGRITPAACGVWIASPRLRDANLLDETARPASELDPEIMLYRLLGQTQANAYGEYNAMLRRIGRFERALDRLTRRKAEK